MAVVAGHDGIDEIGPALDRRLGHGHGCGPGSEQRRESKTGATIHSQPSSFERPMPLQIIFVAG
jgi:hypothetical protein